MDRTGRPGIPATLLLLALACGWAWPVPAEAQAPGYRGLGPAIPSRANGYDYAYAPTILREGGRWHVYFCSTGDGRAWDFVRHATSADGLAWSAPEIVLEGTTRPTERAACDPSVVRYRAPGDAQAYYYLFYTGAPLGIGAALFVARAAEPGGPFAKWTGAGWEADGAAAPIILPSVPHGDGSGYYGAGQASVVVRGGRLQAWFYDDTGCPQRCEQLFEASTADPTRWPERRLTDVRLSSVDVKYDAASRRLVMLGIAGAHSFGSFLVRYVSGDGIAWGRPEIVVPPTGFSHWAHNVGMAGGPEGQMLPGDTLVMFGAPWRTECGICWAHWDLAAGWLPPGPARRP